MAEENKIPINDSNADLIADKLYNKIAGTFNGFMQNIESGIANDITTIKEKLITAEKKAEEALKIAKEKELEAERLDLRADANRDAVKDLRTDYETYKEHLECVAKVRPTLETIQKVFKFWTWKENKLKIIGAIGVTFIIIFVLFWVFLSIMKFKGFISLNGNSQKHSSLEQVILDIKTGNVSNDVRAAKALKLTDAQRDTMIAQKEKILIKPVNIK